MEERCAAVCSVRSGLVDSELCIPLSRAALSTIGAAMTRRPCDRGGVESACASSLWPFLRLCSACALRSVVVSLVARPPTDRAVRCSAGRTRHGGGGSNEAGSHTRHAAQQHAAASAIDRALASGLTRRDVHALREETCRLVWERHDPRASQSHTPRST